MENLECRIQYLEKKCRTLTCFFAILSCFVAYAGVSGSFALHKSAVAQQKPADAIEGNANPPAVIEAQVFILKDETGRIRGVWNADDQSTTLALMYKDAQPIVALSVDQKNASLSLTDVYKGKINLSLTNSIRSISITDDTRNNNIYMGLSGNGDASFDMVSTSESSMVIDGTKSRIDLTGDKATIALAETVGATIALQAQPSTSILSFLDHQGKSTLNLSTVDGKTQIGMNSPVTKEEKIITTVKEKEVVTQVVETEDDDLLPTEKYQKEPEKKSEETPSEVKKENNAEKKENKTSSPFVSK